MVAPNRTKASNIAAPVSVKLGSDSSPIEQLTASLNHPLVSGLSRVIGEGAGAVSDNKDLIPLLDQAKGWKGNANFRQDTTSVC